MGASPPFIVTGTKAAGAAPVMAAATGSPAWTDVATQAEFNAIAGIGPALVAPHDPRLVRTISSIPDVNLVSGVRVIVPRTGTLKELTVYVSVSSGNVDGAVYSTAGTRVRLWSTGSIACPAAGWQSLGNPDVAVTAGDQLDFSLAANNITATFANCQVLPAIALGALPTAFWVASGGALSKLYWYVYAFPAPATIAEASLSGYSYAPFMMARVA